MRGRSIMVLTALLPVALFAANLYMSFPGFRRGA